MGYLHFPPKYFGNIFQSDKYLENCALGAQRKESRFSCKVSVFAVSFF
jgi:hypothetical protein